MEDNISPQDVYTMHLNRRQLDVISDATKEYVDIRKNNWDLYIRDVMKNSETNPLQGTDIFSGGSIAATFEPSDFDKATRLFKKAYLIAHPVELEEDNKTNILSYFDVEGFADDTCVLQGGHELFQELMTILEEYFRIRMGQWEDLSDDLSADGFVYNKNNPNNSKDFNDYLKRRELARKQLNLAYDFISPGYYYKSENQCIAEDIWQVIRYFIWNRRSDEYKKQMFYSVEGNKPLQMSNEALPIINLIKSVN